MRQAQLVQRPAQGEGDVDAARFGFEIDIEDRVDRRGVVKRDRALVDGVLGAVKKDLSLGDVDAAKQCWIASGSTQPQVAIHLQVLGERALELDIRVGVDLHVEAHAAEQAGLSSGRAYGL